MYSNRQLRARDRRQAAAFKSGLGQVVPYVLIVALGALVAFLMVGLIFGDTGYVCTHAGAYQAVQMGCK